MELLCLISRKINNFNPDIIIGSSGGDGYAHHFNSSSMIGVVIFFVVMR